MRLQNKSLVMVRLNEFIEVYEDALQSNTCKTLIDIFENNKDKQERIENDKKPNFTQFNFTKNLTKDYEKIHNQVIKTVLSYKEKYYTMIDPRVFPSENSFEQFRIKKYSDKNDLFDTHVDVKDHESSRRFLAFMFYLNDVECGGETIFHEKKVIPKTGTLLVFPPLWMFPHRGEPPLKGSKYIMSTYLHYK